MEEVPLELHFERQIQWLEKGIKNILTGGQNTDEDTEKENASLKKLVVKVHSNIQHIQTRNRESSQCRLLLSLLLFLTVPSTDLCKPYTFKE